MNRQITAKQQQKQQPVEHSGLLQRKCACGKHTMAGGECAACRKKRLRLQRKAINDRGPAVAPPIVHEVLRSPGKPLDPDTRTFMESRFNHDFSQVRVHTDTKAAASAQAINALAYTVGADVVFGPGQFVPNADEGRKLLAHELIHSIQQGISSSLSSELQIGGVDTIAEREADQMAKYAYASAKEPLQEGNSYSPVKANTLQRLAGPEDEAAREAARQMSRRLANNLTSRTASRAGWRQFWRVVARRFAARGTAALALMAADGPLPIGDFIALGMTILTVYEIIEMWDLLWQEAQHLLETEVQPEMQTETQDEFEILPETETRLIPALETNTQTQRRKRRQNKCHLEMKYPLGGNAEHDALAAFVTGQPVEYELKTSDGIWSARYDGMDSVGTLYEIKTRHEFLHLLNQPDRRLGLKGKRSISEGVPRIMAQLEEQAMVAAVCNFEYRVATNNLGVVEILRELAPNIPVEFVEFPWLSD